MSALALDRQAIEKKDFPIARRGYEPEAVDQHLEALAGEVDRLQDDLQQAQHAAASAGAPPPPPRPAAKQSLALAASDSVRLIVEAAESSAADIERSAQDDAARIRAEAAAEARGTRDEAITRSQDHVGGVSAATSDMLQRVDAMENEIGALVESLRTGTNRLTADLSLLQGNMGELYGAAGSAQAPASTPVAALEVPPLELQDEPEPEPFDEPEPFALGPEPFALEPEPVEAGADAAAPGSIEVPEPAELELEPERQPELEPEPELTLDDPVEESVQEPRGSGGDVEGARLIALNMALNGQSREETDQYLSDNFDLDDRASLLDEVYATVEG